MIILSSFQTKKGELAIIYYENNDLRGVQPATDVKQLLGTNVKPQYSDLQRTDELVFRASEMGIDVPSNWLFYLGFTSPYKDEILYMQTEKFDFGYQVFRYNESTGKRTLILQTGDGPNPEHAYVPFGYTDNPDVIYLEAVYLPSQNEHLGIWTYNLKTSAFTEIGVTEKYMIRPIISPDRKELYYTVTSSAQKDVVHGLADKIMSYQTKTNVENLLVHAPDKQLSIQGLFIGNTDDLTLIPEETIDGSSPLELKSAGSGFKLPWNNGEKFCTTRDGSPRPPVSSLNNGGACYFTFNQHPYKALDFGNVYATGQYRQDNIRAAREGEVIYANYQGCSCTYGNLIKILHEDNLISYYAHLTDISVQVGDCVGQGEIIGTEGGSGDECTCYNSQGQPYTANYGEHLHFEVRTSSSSGTQVWVTFDEYSQTTRQNDLATSGNTPVSCGGNSGGGSCPPTESPTGTISAKTYQASSSITSNGTVNSGTVTFKSPAIYLNDGFTVSNGTFYAENSDCTGSNREDQQTFYDFNIQPNPFSSHTQINFSLSEELPVTIWITDMMGRRITILTDDEMKSAGEHEVIFEAAGYPAGMYFATIQAGKYFGTQKMILTR